MSELLQSGHHPDADQLSAFVEHALPPHEQEQTLAHLEICSDCRSIVSLSLPAIEESPKLQPESTGRPWFFGWNLAWPAAAAVGGLALFIIHIHNVAVTHTNIATPTQMATSHPPTRLPAPIPSTSSASGTTSSLSSERSRSSRPATATGTGGSNQQKTEAIDGKGIAPLPAEKSDFAELKQHQPIRAAGGTQLHGSIGGSAGFSMNSGVAHPATSAGNGLDRLQQNASGVAPVNPGSQTAPAAPAPPPINFRQTENPAAQSAPAAVADAATVRAANQTIEVAAAATPVATLSATSNLLVSNQATSMLAQHPLPSQLPALSAISTAHETLVIDTQNTLFFSDDQGEHWRTIPSQWQGRAVRVDLASSASSVHPPSNPAAFGGPIPRSKVTNSAGLTGTVTDSTGAVIPNASVVVSDATTPNVRTVKADRSGHYLVDDLVPGNYQVEAQAPGFSSQQLAVNVSASQQSMANLTLPVGQAAETVTVDASAKPLATPSLAKKKAPEPQSDTIRPFTLFEITTDTGDHWTSVDGQTWMRR
jgi:hypothetical protein